MTLVKEDKIISVVIPAFNAERTIVKCLESVSAQSYEKLQIIVVNDGSTDKTMSKIVKMSQSDHRIVLVDAGVGNEGVSLARNRAIEVAEGQYIVFIDSDDYVDSNFIRSMYDIAQKTNVNTVIAGYNFALRPAKSIPILPNVNDACSPSVFAKNLPVLMKNRIMLSTVAKLYDMAMVKKFNISFSREVSNGEDILFNLSYFSHCTNYAVVNRADYYYVQYGNIGSLSRREDKSKISVAERIYMESDNFCRKLDIYDQCMPSFARYYMKFCMYTIDQMLDHGRSSSEEIRLATKRFLDSDITKQSVKFNQGVDIEGLIHNAAISTGSVGVVLLLSKLRRLSKRIVRR